jgi:hypothetical protein
MPPILHGVIREGRWPFSAIGSGSLPASGGYGLSAEAQLHRHALIRNIQGGWRKTRRGCRQGGATHLPKLNSSVAFYEIGLEGKEIEEQTTLRLAHQEMTISLGDIGGQHES